MRLLVIAASLVACTTGASVALEAKQSSSLDGTTTCVGQRLGYRSEVIRIGPNTKLLELTLAPTLPPGVNSNFTLKAEGDYFALTAEICPGEDCEYCLYAMGCGSRVSMYPCPYGLFGGRGKSSLWSIRGVEGSSGIPLYRITNVACPSMKLQVWEPSADVLECWYGQDGDCVWSIAQEKACQLPFPADLEGTTCNSDPARSVVSSNVYPNLTDLYSNPAFCDPVTGSSPIDLWELHGLDGGISFTSWAMVRASANGVIWLLLAAASL